MNSIFFDIQNRRRTAKRSGFAVVLVFSIFAPLCLHAQSADHSAAEFKMAAAALSAGRLNGGTEIEVTQEKALAYLDGVAIATLNSSATPNLEGTNQRLAALISSNPPVGENYRLLKLGGSPATYAMVVNFGLGGPAAVRIYAGAAGHYGLAARIDHFTQKDFFDSDIEIVPVSLNEMVFVTVSGRTDDLATGMFSAWRFDGQRAVPLWSSDLLQQSNYEADADGFHLTYCGQPDDDHPAQCLKMTRDLYRYVSGEWKRISTAELPPAKPAAK
jgi:hypothetical protein